MSLTRAAKAVVVSYSLAGSDQITVDLTGDVVSSRGARAGIPVQRRLVYGSDRAMALFLIHWKLEHNDADCQTSLLTGARAERCRANHGSPQRPDMHVPIFGRFRVRTAIRDM
jgi:hypothetical protein